MPVVTKDATKGWWVPASAAEYTSFLSGTGISNPAFLWLCQEASGSLADSVGSCTMAPTNSPGYQAAVSGWSRKAVNWADSSTSRFDNTTVPPDGGTSSLMLFGFFYVSASPTADKFMASMTNLAISFAVDSSGKEKMYSNSLDTGATTISDGVVRPFLIVYNRAASTIKMYTPTETITGTYTSATGVHTVLGAFPALQTPAGGCLYAAQFTGTAAELTATQAATLLDRFQNGPAVSSIAISPTSATLATLGSTQALVATSTRVDTSTFVNTPSVTWSSDAPSIATVNSSGVVTAVSAGTAHITCTYTSLNATIATSNTSTITVTGAATLTSITLAGSSTLGVGYSTQYTATGHYSDSSTADITNTAVWTSSAPVIASVTAGLVTGLSIGSTTITATVGAVNASVVVTTNGLAQTLVDHVTATLPRWLWKGKTAALEWLYAYRDIFDAARAQGQTWLDLTFLDTATGSALDQHAKDRGTNRRLNENDATLRARLKNITDTVTEPALKASVDLILSAAGYGPSFWVVLRRDAAHLSRHDAFLSRGCRMGTKFFPGVDGLTGVAGTPMIYILILPTGTPAAVQNAVAEYLRQYGPAGFAYLLEISP